MKLDDCDSIQLVGHNNIGKSTLIYALNFLEEAILYGSRAKDTYKPGSDIDLTLKGQELDISVMNKISIKLDDLLLPYTFDLSIYKTH